jgi:thiol-disulfide isomerase/thioredoxin
MEHAESYVFEILGEYRFFFLDKGLAEITIPEQSIEKAFIKKSMSESDSQEYLKSIKGEEAIAFGIATTVFADFINSGSKDLVVANQLRENVDSTKKRYEEVTNIKNILWIKQNKNSTINSYILESSIGKMSDQQLVELFYTIPEKNRKNSWGKKLQYYIENLSIGANAPLFSQLDTLGKQVNLADFRGKYVLLDFWASWCVPCRSENPNLIAAKAAFSNKEFTIISISLDEANKRDAWLKAIVDDKMDWVNLSSLTGFKNEAAIKYNIRSIPSNFLISPKGKIISKNLSGKELLEKIRSNGL